MTDRIPVSGDTLKLNPALKDVLTRADGSSPYDANPYNTQQKLKSKGIGSGSGSKPLPDEKEADFQSWLIAYAKLKGWKVAHFRGGWSKDGKRFNTPIQGDKGFFDVPLARNGVVLLIEVKTDIGRLSPEQKEWLAAAGSHGIVARPRDREYLEKLLE